MKIVLQQIVVWETSESTPAPVIRSQTLVSRPRRLEEFETRPQSLAIPGRLLGPDLPPWETRDTGIFFARCGTPCIEMHTSEFYDAAREEFGVRVASISSGSVAGARGVCGCRRMSSGPCYNHRRINDLGTRPEEKKMARFGAGTSGAIKRNRLSLRASGDGPRAVELNAEREIASKFVAMWMAISGRDLGNLPH